LRVGEDLAITGFDDAPMVQYLTPPLTTVRQPIWEVGQCVVSMLADILDKTPSENDQVLLPPKLVIRSSSTFKLN
jgi:DNA-binding LacI/PurR family transcriptional regulator